MNSSSVDVAATRSEGRNSGAAQCPWHAAQGKSGDLSLHDELVLPLHKRVVSRYSTNEAGVREFRLYYGEKEILFDEPSLFAFGEGLARASRFIAESAINWGDDYDWPRVRELLQQLLDEGVLQRAEVMRPDAPADHRALLSPLPKAQTITARTWHECEAITAELMGRAVELGYLETIVPIYRVAHMSVDMEGRQVGESNVFPMHLRLDVPTEWRTCHYAGSRFRHKRPMNVTAMKSMIAHWKPAMLALSHFREAYLRRFPDARAGWTVGHLQRLSSLVLAIPAYLLMDSKHSVENGSLHPVFSSMYRVTDGLRMTMHRMLLTATNEPSLPPDAAITSAEIYAYAESHQVFIADDGVCAGPRAMIEEFLHVLVDGKPVKDAQSIVLDPSVQQALTEIDAALDYGLRGLQAYAVALAQWPVMARAYERLFALTDAWPANTSPMGAAFRARLERNVTFLRTRTRQHSEARRVVHERMHADLYKNVTRALGAADTFPTLASCLAVLESMDQDDTRERLQQALAHRFDQADEVADTLTDYCLGLQAMVRAASDIQRSINDCLGRAQPARPFYAADLALHYGLVGLHYQPEELADVGGRLPNLLDDVAEVLGIEIHINTNVIAVIDRVDAT